MGQKLHSRIEVWKKLLLDFGKRNRLINFLEGKRCNVRIITPYFDRLWELVVANEKEIVFPYARKVQVDDEGEEIYEAVIKGDIETNKPIGDLQKTLKVLRYKANTSIEEQGINTLYLTFGMLKWKERDDSSQVFSSPVILVPVRLLIESITSPYRLVMHDDEIVINPTLSHKLDNDFGIIMPEFDSTHDSPAEYIEKLLNKVKNKGWDVEKSTHLTNLSFLKINMYKDLERNENKISSNPVIAALVGEQVPIQVSEELNNFNHDKQIRPIDTFQVVDADSSQQDAILLSKKGTSFVLQGPPGTGKSQTITNIISEAIADGKKVLFVSEKMAALQVVYNRLANVGLADFCLTLHSHKVKKKEILQDLANSINIDRTRVRDEALAQLDLLERKRNQLNEYQEELHTATSGLNVSIYSVNGKLAKLENVPDVVFGISDTDKISTSVLNERIYLLNELSKTISKQSKDYADNVWCGANVDFLSNALRHDIDSNVSKLIPLMTELERLHISVCSELNLDIAPSLAGSEVLAKVLSIAAKSPMIPMEWVVNHNIELLVDKARQYKEQFRGINQANDDIITKYGEIGIELDASKYKEDITSLMHHLQMRLHSDNANSLVLEIDKIHHNLESCNKSISALFESARNLATILGISAPNTISQLLLFARTMAVLPNIQGIHPTQKWFDIGELALIKSASETRISFHNKILVIRKKILSRFDGEILGYDFYAVLQRFRSEYSSFLRIIKSGYRNDIKQLNSFLSQGGKLSYYDALDTLNSLKIIRDNQTEIENSIALYQEDYGQYYTGVETNWEDIFAKMDVFRDALNQMHTITPQLKNVIINGQLPISDIAQFNILYASLDIESVFEQLTSMMGHRFDKTTQWGGIEIYTNETTTLIKDFIAKYHELISIRKTSCDYTSIISDLDSIISLRVSKDELAKQKEMIYSLYKQYYNGFETNWEKLIEALKYASEFKSIISQYDLSQSFIKVVCEDENYISYCNASYLNIEKYKQSLQDGVKWFVSLFNNGTEFYHYNILDLVNKMRKCKDNKHLLEEWVDYCSNKDKCIKIGLAEYVSKIEEDTIDSNYIVDAYLKRFYHLWLDAVLPNFPAVQNFRGRIQEQTISEFCELDKGQFKIAQARVRERALSRIPDFNSTNGARDEIAILKRELNKQRRLMPLRKLFMAIPNLATSLRPCFMMSPLSVSVFLEAQSYDFDLVIFDEASQVHTQDAIGAIMRGKQIIIVGDAKQLPPTNFFSTSLNDEDFDVDTDEVIEDNDAGAYESILDEAVSVLPERSLRWHYRSRHEHLIAFSNIKIYNNQLITFPSSIENADDCGVEYVYVKNGVYDRGGKKNNVVEARKVADLVFEHFKKHPNRSLGIVTFSEAQQNAVDAAVRQKRLQNPCFDKFFVEDKEEPFFIKNLENVQGDERDTIIFSIGYAKDSKGIMYMNFGPLSREGGYRRLNVAITRAKYNVKMVGSIVPTDIDLDKVSSDGVKMLRSYIEFAQQGIIALEKELTFNYDLDFDSPFEEAIYDFLQSKGYNVVTQVGCSGFRIDMAVKHPAQNGKFAIGIECDGAAYHSSRTARERDRLRQAVLEDMGWMIYRIWSTDWIKDPKREEEKLIKAVEKSIGHDVIEYGINDIVDDDNSDSNTDITFPIIEIEEKVEPSETCDKGYHFNVYKRTPLKLSDESGNQREPYDVILDIILNEQPIHFDEICRRVAPLYGRQKMTSVVQGEVGYVLSSQLKDLIVEDWYHFVKTKDFDDVKVRIPNPDDDYLRPITYICDEELALAMKTIAQHSFGIAPDDLFIITAREFGFKRTGENINSSLRRVYGKMLDTTEISEIDGKVHVN